MYEKGRREPSLSFVYTFTKHYQLTLDQFFLGVVQSDTDAVHQEPTQDEPGETASLEDLADNLKAIVLSLEPAMLANARGTGR